jgi:3-phenylpropionate/cinnamic acid dioxygenase small subunit
MSDLEDRSAIIDLATTYARAVDAKDWDLYRSVFSSDAVIDYTSSGGIRGTPKEAVDWLTDVLQPFTTTQHLVTNHHVVVDGDTATCRSDFFNPMGTPDGKDGVSVFFVGGLYVDTLRRSPNGWLITERVEQMLWVKGATVPGARTTSSR